MKKFKINKALAFSILLLLPLTSKASLYQAIDWVTDNSFTQGIEGPAVNKDGVLFAVNYQEEGTIGKVSGQNKAEVFIRLPEGSIGNGLRFDHKDNLYIADYTGHNIFKVNANSQEVQLYNHTPTMNQPNDLAITDNGLLFASDPNWQNSSGQIWLIDKNKHSHCLEKNMGTTNGIEVSPDNKKLYVNESVQGNVWVYDLNEQGKISNKKLLFKFNDYGLDGMRTDSQGNLYIARYGAGMVAVLSPQGKLLKKIPLKGKFPTNLAFGGPNGKTLFVTMQKRGAIESFRTEFSGRRYRQ